MISVGLLLKWKVSAGQQENGGRTPRQETLTWYKPTTASAVILKSALLIISHWRSVVETLFSNFLLLLFDIHQLVLHLSSHLSASLSVCQCEWVGAGLAWGLCERRGDEEAT